MFGKNPPPAKREAPPAAVRAEPAASPRPQESSSLGRGLLFEGRVSGEGELHIDGDFKGDVAITRLTVGKAGHVEGSITASQVEVRGRLSGEIKADQVRIFATARVEGDIVAERVAMENDAFFQGRITKPKPAAAAGAVVPTAPPTAKPPTPSDQALAPALGDKPK